MTTKLVVVLVLFVACVFSRSAQIERDLDKLERDIAAEETGSHQNAVSVGAKYFGTAPKCSDRDGVCKDASECSGRTLKGLCPGDSSVRCCVEEGIIARAKNFVHKVYDRITDRRGSNTPAAPEAPARDDSNLVPAAPVGNSDIRMQKISNNRWKVTIGDKSVTFSFCDVKWRGQIRPHTLSCSNLNFENAPEFEFGIADFQAAGFGPSLSKIAYGIFKSETGGSWGDLNTYDTEIVTWGGFQMAGKGGSLGILLNYLATHSRSSALYNKYLGDNGVTVRALNPKHPIWGTVVTIRKCDWEKDPGCRHSDDGSIKGEDGKTEGWLYMRNRADLMGALYLMGREKDIAYGQVGNWWDTFVTRALGFKTGGKTAAEWITSEWAVARYLYGYNGNPSYAKNTLAEFVASHPHTWSQDEVNEFGRLAGGQLKFERFDRAVGSQISRVIGSFKYH